MIHFKTIMNWAKIEQEDNRTYIWLFVRTKWLINAEVQVHKEELSEFIVLTRNLSLIFGHVSYIPGNNCVEKTLLTSGFWSNKEL